MLAVAGLALAAPACAGEWRRAEAALERYDLAAAAVHLDRYLERGPATPPPGSWPAAPPAASAATPKPKII